MSRWRVIEKELDDKFKCVVNWIRRNQTTVRRAFYWFSKYITYFTRKYQKNTETHTREHAGNIVQICPYICLNLNVLPNGSLELWMFYRTFPKKYRDTASSIQMMDGWNMVPESYVPKSYVCISSHHLHPLTPLLPKPENISDWIQFCHYYNHGPNIKCLDDIFKYIALTWTLL